MKQDLSFHFGANRITWVEGIGDIDYGLENTTFCSISTCWSFCFNKGMGLYGFMENCYCNGGYMRLNCFQEPGYSAYGNYCYNGSCLISVNEINNGSDIFIYPNPANEKLYLELKTNTAEVRITDVLGNTVKQENTKTEKTSIDVSNLTEGIYFVSVKTSNGVLTKKIIVQH